MMTMRLTLIARMILRAHIENCDLGIAKLREDAKFLAYV